jgi:type I restriction enzyme M protein
MLGLIVLKEKIAANGDYNLSGERYLLGVAGQTRVPMVPLGDVAELIRGITFGKSEQLDRATDDSLLVATTKAAQSSGIVEADLYHVPRTVLKDDAKLLRSGDILISTANSLNLLGRTTHVLKVGRPMSFGAFMSLIRANEKILDGYLIHCLRTAHAADYFVRNANTTTNISNLNLSALAEFQIPLPPLEVQKEIVAEIEGYQKVINGARAVLDHYRPHIPIHPDWPMVPLGDHFSTSSGGTPSKDETSYWIGDIPWVSPKDMKSDVIVDTEDHISNAAVAGSATKLFPAQTVVCVVRSGILKHSFPVALLSRPMCINQDLIAFQPKGNAISSEFLFYVLKTRSASILADGIKPGVTVQSFYNGFFKNYEIPLPPLATQQAIVAEIEAEQALVAASRELIARFEQKIQATLTRVWGEDVARPT